LQAFGASPEQIDKVQQAWLAASDNATITIGGNLNNDAYLTLRQYNALKKIADDRKLPPQALINDIHMEALMEALQAHEKNFSQIHDYNITDETKPIFQKKIEALAHNPSTATAP
jgi:predicted DNA-binding ribbon-helix-helix protein